MTPAPLFDPEWIILDAGGRSVAGEVAAIIAALTAPGAEQRPDYPQIAHRVDQLHRLIVVDWKRCE